MVRAIRGATTVENNDAVEILRETEKLLTEIYEKNKLKEEDLISIIFTVTNDLNATFPAVAARNLGWTSVALMCTNEIPVPGSLEKCIRVLMHINTDKRNDEIKHIYLNNAKVLRPDIVSD
ncbi:chorismate mutase [Acetivibrio clariflavus]|uniref:chorismate mutase n=1 Tax=Acetivibrio clariflavus (strain DSM 19732 / NBRC 101661 / EBR45) TaxID=720554 RepID=G8LU69_ACECE|nr:chorismate mutase [Acetivibrio clariflavus]AEV68457.1 monofunctional chorismate mutase, clade 1 [Acetivibrio clariflavus DSM 19732]